MITEIIALAGPEGIAGAFAAVAVLSGGVGYWFGRRRWFRYARLYCKKYVRETQMQHARVLSEMKVPGGRLVMVERSVMGPTAQAAMTMQGVAERLRAGEPLNEVIPPDYRPPEPVVHV